MHVGIGLLLCVIVVFASGSVQAHGTSPQPWDCAAGRATPSKDRTRLAASQAIELASTAAKREGVDLTKFRSPSLCFDASKPQRTWAVFYDGVELSPGNHFLVSVRDTTGATKLMWGE